jgi:predicted alpha/beta superfamily hydrolase
VGGDLQHLGRIASPGLGNERDVWVHLPAVYSTSPERRFPVIYFQDGQNVFDPATSFLGVDWRAGATLDALEAAGGVAAIAVAVGNTPARMHEYTPVRDALQGAGGGADLYLQFLVHELKPRLDAELRTLPGRRHTAIVGSSLGGLVALYAGVAAWRTFGLVGALSPSLYWGEGDIRQRYAAAPRPHLPLRLWIDMGTAEREARAGSEGLSEPVRELRDFRALLEQRGLRVGAALGYCEAPGARHDEGAWAARLPDALRFLLPAEARPVLAPTVAASGGGTPAGCSG